MRFRSHSVLPGFAPTLGFSLLYLSLMVLLPLSALVLYSVTKQDMGQFWQVVSNPRVVASFKLSFGAAAVAALLNTLFGSIIAWILVRYQFFGKRIMDALIDYRLRCQPRYPVLRYRPSSRATAGSANMSPLMASSWRLTRSVW